MSFYAEYVKERAGHFVIEDDDGFVEYSLQKDCIFIENMYVRPEMRRDGIGTRYLCEVEEIGQKHGYHVIGCGVCPSALNHVASLQAALASGFSIYAVKENYILLSKELIWVR